MKRQVAAVVGGQSQIGFVKEKIKVHYSDVPLKDPYCINFNGIITIVSLI